MKNVYYEIRDFLQTTPQGFPSTESGIEIKILKKLFIPEHAEIFVKIIKHRNFLKGYVSGKDKKLQKILKMSEEKLTNKLDEMSKKGLFIRQRLNNDKNQPIYYPPAFIVGLYEFSINSMDKELAELCSEYIKHLADWQNSIYTKQLRIIPVESSLNAKTNILAYNQVKEIIKGHDTIAVAPCICALESKALGIKCKAPIERCISFDWYAEHYIDTGLGRQITEEELYDKLELAEKEGLGISSSNTYPSIGFCLCCECCCAALKMLRLAPKPAEQTNSFYHAELDPEKCVQCDLCFDRCHIDAIKKGKSYHIDLDRCGGCGLCITTCPKEALKMVENNVKHKAPPAASIPMALNMYEEHIKAGHFPRKDLIKVKFAKSVIKTANIIQKLTK